MKKARYHKMLRSDINQFVSRSSCKTLEDMIARPREREIDLEAEKKRKLAEFQISMGSGKRPKTSDSRLRGPQDRGRCGKCGGMHEGTYRSGSGGDSGYFKCGHIGNFRRDCTAITT